MLLSSVLQVNAVVLCRVVMVTVSSAHRRTKMLSPSSASKMQTFDLTWWDTIKSQPLSVALSPPALCLLCFMNHFLLYAYTHSHSLPFSHTPPHRITIFYLAERPLVNRDSVRDWEFTVGVAKAYQLNTWSQHNCVCAHRCACARLRSAYLDLPFSFEPLPFLCIYDI